MSNVDLHLSTQMPHVQPEYKNSSSSVHETRIDFEQSDGGAAAGIAEGMNVCCSVGVPELAVSFDIIGLMSGEVRYDEGERTGSALRVTLPVIVSEGSVGEEGRVYSVPSIFGRITLWRFGRLGTTLWESERSYPRTCPCLRPRCGYCSSKTLSQSLLFANDHNLRRKRI